MNDIPSSITSRYRFVRTLKKEDPKKQSVYLVESLEVQGKYWVVKRGLKRYIERERDILIKLQQTPFTPVYHDIFEEGEFSHLVMQYISNKHLGRLLREQGLLPEHEVLQYFEELCRIFAKLHSMDIIYEDCKPSNIMVYDMDNILRLIDFSTSNDGTEPRLRGSTNGYRAPEQYDKDLNVITDERTDVYGLGATIYNLLTGERIPDNSTPEHVRHLNPDVSENLEAIVMKCLEKSPDNRYQNMGDILIDINALHEKNKDERIIVIEAPVKKELGRSEKLLLNFVGATICALIFAFGAFSFHRYIFPPHGGETHPLSVAQYYLSNGRPNNAHNHVQEFLRENPDSPYGIGMLIYVLIHIEAQENYSDGIYSTSRIHFQNIDNFDYYNTFFQYKRGLAYLHHPDEMALRAQEYFYRVINDMEQPSFDYENMYIPLTIDDVLIVLASSYQQLGEWEQAISLFELVMTAEATSRIFDVYVDMIQTYHHSGNYALAVTIANEGLSRFHDNFHLLLYRAISERSRSRIDNEIDQFLNYAKQVIYFYNPHEDYKDFICDLREVLISDFVDISFDKECPRCL